MISDPSRDKQRGSHDQQSVASSQSVTNPGVTDRETRGSNQAPISNSASSGSLVNLPPNNLVIGNQANSNFQGGTGVGPGPGQNQIQSSNAPRGFFLGM